jgi:hypothetical protein
MLRTFRRCIKELPDEPLRAGPERFSGTLKNEETFGFLRPDIFECLRRLLESPKS